MSLFQTSISKGLCWLKSRSSFADSTTEFKDSSEFDPICFPIFRYAVKHVRLVENVNRKVSGAENIVKAACLLKATVVTMAWVKSSSSHSMMTGIIIWCLCVGEWTQMFKIHLYSSNCCIPYMPSSVSYFESWRIRN